MFIFDREECLYMSKSIISEGKTTNEAIEKGLKELNVSKNMVDIKILDNDNKKSFFSILTPRVVKVQLTLKENSLNNKTKKEIELTEDEKRISKENLEKFLDEFFANIDVKPEISITFSNSYVDVNLKSENLGFLIGYRGETLYAFQTILSSVASKGLNKNVKVILDIEGYKDKRKKTLEDFAEKMARKVVKTRKNVILEPMQAYERKIIHTKLQGNDLVETRSIGEEPRRKLVISLKSK